MGFSTAYMVEIWPYAERSRGIAYFQLWGRLAGFFTTFVNPIGLQNSGWRYLISYVVFLSYEITFVYFFFPETFGRTLEELTFCKSSAPSNSQPSIAWADQFTFLSLFEQCSRTRRLQTRPSMLWRKPWDSMAKLGMVKRPSRLRFTRKSEK